MMTRSFVPSARRNPPALVLFCLCCLLSHGTMALGQGSFRLTEAGVRAMTLTHYYGPDRKLREPDFTFAFGKDSFVLKKGKAPIPADLVARLLPDELAKSSPAEITGAWVMKDGELVLTNIKAGDHAGRNEVTLAPYMTAARVVRIGQVPQYVFEVKE